MLYLDKCWPCLQHALRLDAADQRPSAELVRGNVTMVGLGWIPFERVLDPREVREIAIDLAAAVHDEEVIGSGCRFDGGSCASTRLEDARRFTAELSEAGHGLVYLIG